MKRKILAGAILSALLSTTALADTSSINSTTNMGVLENEWVRAGVNVTSGSFGSGGNTSPGLLFDPTGTGTFNTSYDYLTPGSPFDGFAINVDGTNYSNNNARTNAIEGSPTGFVDGENTLTWNGAFPGFGGIIHTYTLAPNTPYIDISSTIELGEDATDVWFGRFIDPDSQGMPGDSSSTDNVLGYGVIPDSNVAFSEATVSRYALGLYSTDSNVDAGITRWSQEADAYINADASCGAGITFCNADDTIGLSWHWSSVSAGDILTASYAYIFGPSAFDAAEDAITGGAGGGADTSSWGTLTDVGSATDAASGTSSTPTLVSTSDPVITYGTWGAWATNTSLPVLTQSQTTHSASDDGKVQTVDRTITTIVTTPELRTRSTTTTVTDTYSDSSTVDRVTATGTNTESRNNAVTTVTDPGSFVGRIDQVATASDVVGSALRTTDFSQVNAIAMDNTYDNGMTGRTNGFVAGGVDVKENNIIVGAGVAKLNTSMIGNGDTVKGETTAISGVVGKHTDRGDVTAHLTHGMTDYTMSRTIGDFANEGATKGTDTAISLRFEGAGQTVGNATVSPIVGVTKGKRVTDAYTETGSIQSARTVAETTDDYSYATVGASVEIGLFDLVALHNTDGVNDISLGIEKETDKVTWGIRGHRTMTNLGDTNSVSLGVSIKF